MGYLHCHLDSDLYWVVSRAYVHIVFHFTIINQGTMKANRDSSCRLVLGLATCAVESCNLVKNCE